MSKDKKQRRIDHDTRVKRQSAIMTKLVNDNSSQRAYGADGNRKPQQPPMSVLNAVSDKTANVVNDLDSLEQLLPDIELAAQILVSSILSPKDMGAPNLSFTVNSQFKEQEVAGKMLKVIDDYFTNDYRINEELSDILHDILFKKGSYVRMVVPESSLDQLINEQGRMSLESIRSHVDPADMSARPIGLLGDFEPVRKDDDSKRPSNQGEERISLESLSSVSNNQHPTMHYRGIGESIMVVDNPDAVKMPSFFDKVRRDRFAQQLSSRHMTMEARRRKKEKEEKDAPPEKKKTVDLGNTDSEIENRLKSNRRDLRVEPVVELKNRYDADRDTVGHPMVINLATEAVIPAHVPSNPRKHIGYFVLLDQYGNPISTATTTDHYRYLQKSFQDGQSNSSVDSVLKEMRGGMDFADAGSHYETIAQATSAFADIIERNLLSRIRKGMGHESVELGRPDDVYQIMFARTLKKKRTQVLFVPVELMSYMAFYHTNQGVGKSLLEESRVLGSIRVLLMFANTMASIRNSTSQTELGIQLDPNDTDPLSTISQVKEAFMRSRSEQFPLGEGDPSAVVRYLQQAGVSVVYSGHEGLPDMRVESNDTSSGRVMIDRELEESLRHQHIMSMGLSPETVDASSNVDFATTLVNSSLMLAKRVAIYQKKFETQKADFVRKFTENSETLITRMEKIVNDHGPSDAKSDPFTFIMKFIESIEVELPKPDYVTLESHMQAFEQYTRALEEAVNAWISDEFAVMDAEGDMANYLRELREAIIAYYKRRWLRENNVMPELEEMTDVDDKGKATFNFGEIHADHMKSIMAFVEDYLKDARAASLAREKKAEKEQEKLEKKYSEQANDNDNAADAYTGGSADAGGEEMGGEEEEGLGEDTGLGGDEALGGEEDEELPGAGSDAEDAETGGEDETGGGDTFLDDENFTP
jgi:hypothetical protein